MFARSMSQRHILFSLFCAMVFQAFGQNPKSLPENYFDAPVNIPMYLAGNFGEIRGNHFHAGIDIKTNQVEGLPVFASAEGFVSRIKVGLYGYGKAVYIEHPNGYTTCYAHLLHFNEELEKYVRNQQYKAKTYEVDVYPKPGALKISRGEEIAKSGNTGGSGGPHLHFEIRKTAGQIPVNPLLFNFDIKDNIKPIIKTISVYPLNDTSLVNGKHEPLHTTVRGHNGVYHLPGPLQLTARGVIGVGIETIDKANGVHNRLGAYRVSMVADGDTAYRHEMFEIPFALSRYINAHIDYYESAKRRRRVQKSFIEPNNKLNIYQTSPTKGKLFFNEYGHDVYYEVKDAYGNTSNIRFTIDVDRTTPPGRRETPPNSTRFSFKKENEYSEGQIAVRFPSYSLYNDLDFTHKTEPPLHGAFCEVHHIGNLYTPLHKYIDVSISLDSVPRHLRERLYAVSLDSRLRVISPEGGSLSARNIFSFRTRSLGPYTVLADTSDPVIKGGFASGIPVLTKNDRLKFVISDNESGIDKFEGFVDGNWVLMEFDYKTGEFWFQPDAERLAAGIHELKIYITDAVGNTAVEQTEFKFAP